MLAEFPTGREETATSLGLVRRDDGSYLYVDPGKRFRMVIKPDGRVQFADRWKRPDDADSQHGECCGAPPEGALVAINPFFGIAVPGTLEWAMKARELDPRVAAKASVLRDTERFRTKLTVAWYRQNIAYRLRSLRGELDQTWEDDAIPVARRKAILFERWDECEDRLGTSRAGIPADAIPQLDEERRRAADEARRIIIGFILDRVPAGHEHAFSATELARLNARRRSVIPFTPYRQDDS